jgi:hypothetical protein
VLQTVPVLKKHCPAFFADNALTEYFYFVCRKRLRTLKTDIPVDFVNAFKNGGSFFHTADTG